MKDTFASLTLPPLDQPSGPLRPSNPLHPQPIVSRIQHPARHVRRLDAVIQEWVREVLSVKLWVVRRGVEDEIANAANLVTSEEVEAFADEEKRLPSGEEGLSSAGNVLIRRVPWWC